MFSFSRVIHSCVRQVVNEKSNGGFDMDLEELNNSSVSPCRLPRYEVGLVLSNAYFENVHLQYPFLHETTFRQWEKNAAGLDCACATPTELFFVNMASKRDRINHPGTMLMSCRFMQSDLCSRRIPCHSLKLGRPRYPNIRRC